MSDIITRLEAARERAWADLRPAFDHAIVLAKEAEHDADRAMNIAMTGVSAAYPPLVLLLAESVPAPPFVDPWAQPAAPAPGATP